MMDLIIVCSTRESEKIMKAHLRDAGLDVSQIKFVTPRTLDTAEGMCGLVLVEPRAMILAERLYLSRKLHLWAIGCRAAADMRAARSHPSVA